MSRRRRVKMAYVSVETVVVFGIKSFVINAVDSTGGFNLNAFFHLLNNSVNASGSSSGSQLAIARRN